MAESISEPRDDAIRATFETVDLDEILERVDGNLEHEIDWANVLSLGEQQRVSFARPRRRLPRRGDEPARRASERRLYERLRALGIAYVSVGHRSTLKAFHDHLVTLRADGSWEMESLTGEEGPTEEPTRRRAAGG